MADGSPDRSALPAKNADELLGPVRKMFAALQRANAVGAKDIDAALGQLTEASAAALGVARSSVWRFSPDRKEIRCLDLFEVQTGRHSSGARLRALDAPHYFAALGDERTIDAADARIDPRTNELHEAYLAPLAITAMLDAPLWFSGELIGVVCNEHIGTGPRPWLYSEELVAGMIADYASMVLATAERAGQTERARGELLDRERAARREAEAANRAKDEFLAVLGHELRNPLAPIVTALDLMRSLGSAAAVERAVIERQVDHLGRLVDDMLDVVRITRGKIELRPKPIELRAIVEEGIEMASPLLEQRRHTLEVDVPSEGLRLDGDVNRLGQVVSNLLANAAKCTPHFGRVKIVGRAENAEITLSVSDTGVGIAAELLPRIFEAFVQGERRPDRSQGGLGLGLAIVRGIIVAHGGTVSAHSEGMGKGSEFVVRLPALPDSVQAGLELVRPGPQPTPSVRRRVLIVDDNEDAAVLLAKCLERYGHQTVTAFDGPSALARAAEFQPEAVLLDLGLPVMDGFEVARRLRELPSLAQVKLVAVTGYGSPRDFQRSAAAGFNEHLVKPVNFARLESLMIDLFE